MPSKTIKKGFKTVSSKIVTKENLAYEDVEDEHTITPKATKSKMKSKSVDRETNKKSGKEVSTGEDKIVRKRQRAHSDNSTSDSTVEEEHNVSKKAKQKKTKPSLSSSSTSTLSKSTPKKDTTLIKRKSSSKKLNEKEIITPDEQGSEDIAGGAVKTYYPKIPFDHIQLVNSLTGTEAGTEMKGKSSGKKRKSLSSQQQQPAMSHQDKAAALVSAICTAEQEGLQDYFSSRHASRDHVLHSLTAVIGQLPNALLEHFSTATATATTSDDDDDAAAHPAIVYEPELSTREQNLLENRYKYLQKMAVEMAVLQEYANNVTKLEEDFGSAAVGVPVPPLSASAASSGSGSGLDSRMSEVEQTYASHLERLGEHVGAVQGRLAEINAGLAGARGGQDALYDACQKIRFIQPPPSSRPSSSSAPPPPLHPCSSHRPYIRLQS